MTDTPIHLDVQTVARAALKAYEEGRLSAQGPTPACRYRDDSGRPCAIGAAIPDDVATEWDKGVGEDEDSYARALYGAGKFTTDDLDLLADLQARHDLWTQFWLSPSAPTNEQSFLTLCRELAGVETTEQEASQ